MKKYAVIDTNVLVSAMLKWTSVPETILEFAFSGTIIPVINDKIVLRTGLGYINTELRDITNQIQLTTQLMNGNFFLHNKVIYLGIFYQDIV